MQVTNTLRRARKNKILALKGDILLQVIADTVHQIYDDDICIFGLDVGHYHSVLYIYVFLLGNALNRGITTAS